MTVRAGETYRLIAKEDNDVRLDIWIGDRLKISRSQVKNLVDQGLVLINDVPGKASYRIQEGDEILVSIPVPPQAPLQAEPIPLDIIYEDQELAVINKPKGLVVHPGVGNLEGTLVNALLYHMDELAEGEESERPGIVHRLDKDTSGLMVVAKTDRSYAYLRHLLQKRKIERRYLALVQGVMSTPKGVIDQPLGRNPKDRKKRAVIATGREAQTIFQVEERFLRHSLVRCKLVTGRPHQIRVHLASIHHPLVGDPLYGFKTNNLGSKSQVLHAVYLAFTHPKGHFVEFESTPNKEFLAVVDKARMMN